MNRKLISFLILLIVTGCATRFTSPEKKIVEENVKKLVGTEIKDWGYNSYYDKNGKFVFNTITIDNCRDCARIFTITDASYNEDDNYVHIKTDESDRYEKDFRILDLSNEILLSLDKLKKALPNSSYKTNSGYKKQFLTKEMFFNLYEKSVYTDKLNSIYEYKFRNNPDTYLSEMKDPKIIIDKYVNVLKKLLIGWNRYSIEEEYVEELQKIAKPNKLLKCYAEKEYLNEYINNEDECILYRRTDNSNEILFNYKKYLPQIKSDEQFRKVVKVFNWYYTGVLENGKDIVENQYCNSQKQITTKEREDCIRKTEEFFTQVVVGNAPYCKNKNKNEWNKSLENAKSVGSGFVNFFEKLDTYSYKSNFQEDFSNQIKNSFGYNIMNEVITNYGKDNFCITDDWEKDLENLLKSGKIKKKTSVIELN